jgi:hypothetical protein
MKVSKEVVAIHQIRPGSLGRPSECETVRTLPSWQLRLNNSNNSDTQGVDLTQPPRCGSCPKREDNYLDADEVEEDMKVESAPRTTLPVYEERYLREGRARGMTKVSGVSVDKGDFRSKACLPFYSFETQQRKRQA